MKVNKEHEIGIASGLLLAHTKAVSDQQIDAQREFPSKNLIGKVDQGVANEDDFQTNAKNEGLQGVWNKISMTSNFSKDIVIENVFDAPVKEVREGGGHSSILKGLIGLVFSNCGGVDKGMEKVHLHLPSIVGVLKNSEAKFFDTVEYKRQQDKAGERRVTSIHDMIGITSKLLHYYVDKFLDELLGLVDFTMVHNSGSKQKCELGKTWKLSRRFEESSVCFMELTKIFVLSYVDLLLQFYFLVFTLRTR